MGEYYEVTDSSVTKYYGGAAMRVGGTLSYLLSDHLGSNSLILDTAGNVVGETRYTAWGEERYSSGSVSTDYTYTGQYSNTDDFGLMYYKARWYDPVMGRFAQADSIVPGAGNPISWDRYAYVGNNPVINTDPSGHMYDQGCKTSGCSIFSGGVDYDYVYNVYHNNNERQENTEIVENAESTIETVTSVVFEPADWLLTTRDCIMGECSPVMLLGLLPLVPGSKVDDIVDAVRKLDWTAVDPDVALDLARKFLGDDYIDMGNGRFLSADGLRQVRMGIGDLLGHGDGPSHMNFEILGPSTKKPGKNTIIENLHILLTGE